MLYLSFTARLSHDEPKSRLMSPRIRTIVTGIRTAFSVIRTGRVNFWARKRLKIKKRDPSASLLLYPTSKISPQAGNEKDINNRSPVSPSNHLKRAFLGRLLCL